MGRNNEDWDPFADDDEGDSLVKRLRAELKKRDATIAEQDTKLTKLESSVSQRSIADVLQSKGVKAGFQRTILRDLKEDGTDVTPEAVEQWLTENADAFGITLNPTAASAEQSAEAPTAEGVSAEDIAALRQISSTEQGALSPTPEGDVMARLTASDLTQEELLRLMGQPVSRS